MQANSLAGALAGAPARRDGVSECLPPEQSGIRADTHYMTANLLNVTLNGPSSKSLIGLPSSPNRVRLRPTPVTLAGSSSTPFTGCPCFRGTKSFNFSRCVCSRPAGAVLKACAHDGTDMVHESAVCKVSMYCLPSPAAVTSIECALAGKPSGPSSPNVRQLEKPPPFELIVPANSIVPASVISSADCDLPPMTWSSMTNQCSSFALAAVAPAMAKPEGAARAAPLAVLL
mmetsp:Transcript_7538/g.19119  ORF Transcript_7538/g.19119 Transcript_7538/m.19119 type:complete len:230 (+) Transcript_7538:42-731(+)